MRLGTESGPRPKSLPLPAPLRDEKFQRILDGTPSRLHNGSPAFFARLVLVMSRLALTAAFASLLAVLPYGTADEPAYNPPIAAASNEAELAIKGFRIPQGMSGRVWAAEPMLANPVAFCIDEKGRIFVAETFRQEKGVEDNRAHMNWLGDDLKLQTVEERLEMFKKHLGDKVNAYGVEHDRIRRLVDRDGDGKADESTVYADGFKEILDGTGAGLLVRGGTVLFTCIPKLWSLRDTNDDGVADERKALHHGYGVRIAFRGHDLHGLTLGPDGRIYFSIGDRGYNVEFEGKRLARPETGAVFRCEPDGSGLEVFCYGLRNPQELAFDDFGNLFTCDNNSDSGDRARWTYLVEGGDIGWRMYYQYLSDRGPWNRERIWHPYKEDHVAYTVPPIANFSDGPSGLVFYPGVGLPERYKNHFFLVDFRGGPSNSGIRSFSLKPNGATFEMEDAHEFLWQILATDVDFGYDGGLYVSDWVNGWTGLGKGRIYRFQSDENIHDPAISSAQVLMEGGFRHQTPEQLANLLDHADRRVRLEAQISMAEQGFEKQLISASFAGKPDQVRRHAIWGLGQRARGGSEVAVAAIASLLRDSEAEIRAQAARTLGESARTSAESAKGDLLFLLRDESLRVRSCAAQAVGQLAERDLLSRGELLPALATVLAENANKDPIVRHAAALALSRVASTEELVGLMGNPSAPVRQGAVVALRRLRSPELSRFLDDIEPAVVVEAARAIHDEMIVEALPSLALLADRSLKVGNDELRDALVRRVLDANFRVGQAEGAARLAFVAADSSMPDALRLEAIEELKLWKSEVLLDRVTGEHRPRKPADEANVRSALLPVLGGLFQGSDAVRKAASDLAAAYGIREVEPVLAELLQDRKGGGATRAAALQALIGLKSAKVADLSREALKDSDPLVRIEARRALASIAQGEAPALLSAALETGEPSERQAAVADLAGLKSGEADGILKLWLTRLKEGKVPAELQLDLVEAGRSRPDLKGEVETWEKSHSSGDELAGYRLALAGGNADRGRELFFGRGELSCRRCHTIAGQGGAVGPDLTKGAVDKTREYLLESIVVPNKAIAKGFESLIVITDEGKSFAGIVKESTDESLKLMQSDGTTVTIPKSSIDESAKGISAMPGDIVKKLTLRELRDLVEYLSTLK